MHTSIPKMADNAIIGYKRKMSAFTRLDYSEHERRRRLDVVYLFKEKDTRDELGLGSIGDAYANLFFPGTSAIQTWGRYFLWPPWIYQHLENRRTACNKAADRARNLEVAHIEALSRSADTDEVTTRAEQLRTAFNAPFWLFVLVTTSVGQEGLDFHP